MEISHVCMVEIKGIQLDKNSVIEINNYVITNDSNYIKRNGN
ncbi:hypothetical protein SAMN05216324_11971 [Chryseobacterium limigenitum]|uniref:Uncharacterized protein n=1 Tax=Chryseobacterium limigenitum TaxID=1612149 RepID=A0A1K2IVU8_9FLAO|nr:hypothetical protein SAMN05216324_11971 [Chryseobacterium limigenitum]